MPDRTKLAACSPDMVCAEAEATLLGMRLAFLWILIGLSSREGVSRGRTRCLPWRRSRGSSWSLPPGHRRRLSADPDRSAFRTLACPEPPPGHSLRQYAGRAGASPPATARRPPHDSPGPIRPLDASDLVVA